MVSSQTKSHLALAQARIAHYEDVWIATQRDCVAVVHIALAATKEREEHAGFDQLLTCK